MTVYHNYPVNFIDNSEAFSQYCSWLLIVHKGNTIHPTTTQFRTAQLGVETNSNVLTDLTMLTYIRPVKCNVKMFNDSKAPAKGFGLFIIKIPKTYIIISLCKSYDISQTHKTQ